jgi:hypothetical protein
MQQQVDQEHIKELLATGEFSIGPSDVVRDFSATLDSAPWEGTGLRWTDIGPSTTIDLSSTTDIVGWLQGTRLAEVDALLVRYSDDEPGIIGRPESVLRNLDVLYWRSPGRGYLCALERVDSGWQIISDNYAEYDGGQRVTALRRLPRPTSHERTI